MRRTWFKAYEILESILNLIEERYGKEKDIFKYQFLLNYLNLKSTERFQFIMHHLAFISNHE
jgi:hypothetical protein